MNRGVLHQSSPVQQLMAAGDGPNWWNINTNIVRPSPPPPHNNIVHQHAPPPSSFSWHQDNQELPESWSQLLMGGLVVEEGKSSSSLSAAGLSHIHQQAKKLEIWEEQVVMSHDDGHRQAPINSVDHHVKQEKSPNVSYDDDDHHHHHHVYENINNTAELIQAAAAKPTWFHQNMPVSSPKSCVTSLNSNMLEFSNNKADGRHPPPDHSSECNSTATGGAAKKARVESSSSTHSTFKVRKEKLGDRITALHQIVSPFGKTDTASVLFEVLGYIKFLQSQIEALSLPYLASGISGNNIRQQQSVEGERNCLFPEDPGQLLNDNCTKRKVATKQESLEEAKDLRSKGLCLVPISCTLQVGSHETNGADYWAPPAL